MSISEMSVVKVMGPNSILLYDSLRKLASRQNIIDAGKKDDWVTSKKEIVLYTAIDAKVEQMQAMWGECTLVYASKYIDNDSVGGSTIIMLSRCLAAVKYFQTGMIYSSRFRVWFLMPRQGREYYLFKEIEQASKIIVLRTNNVIQYH